MKDKSVCSLKTQIISINKTGITELSEEKKLDIEKPDIIYNDKHEEEIKVTSQVDQTLPEVISTTQTEQLDIKKNKISENILIKSKEDCENKCEELQLDNKIYETPKNVSVKLNGITSIKLNEGAKSICKKLQLNSTRDKSPDNTSIKLNESCKSFFHKIELNEKMDKTADKTSFKLNADCKKIQLDKKSDTIAENISLILNKDYKNIRNKIESSSTNIEEVLHKNVDEINSKNYSNFAKSMKYDDTESESISSIEQFINVGFKDVETSISNKKEDYVPLSHKEEEKKNNVPEIKNSQNKDIRKSVETSSKLIETIAPKPKHIFKFVDESNIKRPPTRMSRKIKLNRSSSSDTFKVPQLSVSPSTTKVAYLSPKKEYESPRSSFYSRIPKRHEKEFDSISIYAETIEAESVKNDSDTDVDLENYNTPEVNFTKVNDWLSDIKQNTELSNEEKSINDNDKINTKKNETINDEISNLTIYKKKLEACETNTEAECSLQNSISHHNPYYLNRGVYILRNICNNIKFRGKCTKIHCIFEHNLTKLQQEMSNLSVEDLFVVYDTMKQNSYFYIYKYLFSTITECLGHRRDFNKLISMVKDVLEINLNSVRTPFIKNIIDALCNTGVAFHSMVEVVYKNANVSETLMNLLRDILLNITVEQKKSNESWNIVKEIINNKTYDLDVGIIKLFIIESIENESCSKELSFKIYHDVLSKISDSKLVSLVESLLHNFYYILQKHSYIKEANELCTRCYNLNIKIGPNNDSNKFSSPESINHNTQNSPTISNSSVVNHTPLQNNCDFDANSVSSSVDSLYFIESKSNTTSPKFQSRPVLPFKSKTELFTTPLPLVNNRPASTHSRSLYRHKPLFERHTSPTAPATVSIRPNNAGPSLVPIRPNYISNLYTTNVKPRCTGPPLAFKSGSPNYALANKISSTTHEVNQAIYEKNVVKIHGLVLRHKDNDFTDKFISIVIENILQSDIDIIWFFQEMCNTAKCLSNLEDKALSYVLKTIGLNITLNLTKNQKWKHATVISNILRSNFHDIFNVKTYLDETYSYVKRILIFARIHTKNNECVKAWNLICETFQNNCRHSESDVSFRNLVIDELLNVVNINKMWNIGLRILKFVIENCLSGVDIKKRASEVLLHAINSKCGMNYIMEFVKYSQNWYNYISTYIFRSIVAYAVHDEHWEKAIEFYSIGCTCDIYPQIFGNERCITISSQYVLEEIWLMFKIYLRKRYVLGKIKHNIIVKILEMPYLVPIEDIPNNLRQYNMDTTVLRARVANVLNNYIKPAIKIVNDQNYIILKENEVNNHIMSIIGNTCV